MMERTGIEPVTFGLQSPGGVQTTKYQDGSDPLTSRAFARRLVFRKGHGGALGTRDLWTRRGQARVSVSLHYEPSPGESRGSVLSRHVREISLAELRICGGRKETEG